MPRRFTRRCGPRGEETITLPQEHNAIFGDAWGFADFNNVSDFEDVWLRFGDELVERHVEAFAGSRPAIMYIMSILPPPSWVNPTPVCRHMLRDISGSRCPTFDTSALRHQAEFDHLRSLGVLDDAEVAAARKRLREPDGSRYSRYKPMHNEHRGGLTVEK